MTSSRWVKNTFLGIFSHFVTQKEWKRTDDNNFQNILGGGHAFLNHASGNFDAACSHKVALADPFQLKCGWLQCAWDRGRAALHLWDCYRDCVSASGLHLIGTPVKKVKEENRHAVMDTVSSAAHWCVFLPSCCWLWYVGVWITRMDGQRKWGICFLQCMSVGYYWLQYCEGIAKKYHTTIGSTL